MPRTVAVVGGGVAGLVAARELADRGDDVVVLEASDRPGGALRSSDLDGVTVDVGAEAFAVTRPETRALIDELGLSALIVSPRRSDAHLLLPDGLFDMPHAMLGIPTDLAAAAIVAVLGPAEAAAAQARDAEPLADLDPRITLGELVRVRMGDAVVTRVLLPVVAGVHAADPDLVEADAVIPGILAAARAEGSLAGGAARLRAASGVPGAAISGLRGGMTALVSALADDTTRRGVRLRCDSGVRSLMQAGGRWHVQLANEDLVVDDLVLAVDAPTAAHLTASLPEVAAPLAAVGVGDVAVVALVLAEPSLDEDPVGSGLLIAPGHPSVRAKALTHATAKWDWIREAYGPGRHLVRLSYGRDGRIDESLDDLPAIATADVAAIFGNERPVVLASRVARWDRSLVRPAPGHRDRVAAVRAAADALPTLAVVGAGLGGNGLAGTIATSRSVTSQLTRG